jgi:5-methylcytosine-specific restriction endonuclease McrA
MTTHRRPEIPFTDAPRGTCRWCGQYIVVESGQREGEVNKRRRWHPACVDIYNVSDPREARRRIRKRDRGHCARCGVDTYKVRREFMKIKRGRFDSIRAAGYKPRKSFWELDHIVPLIDDGSHDDDNLQTLCTPCHSAKTAEEASERALRSREAEAASSKPIAEPTPQSLNPKKKLAKKPGKRVEHNSLDELFEAADAVNARVKQVLAPGKREPSPTSETPTA